MSSKSNFRVFDLQRFNDASAGSSGDGAQSAAASTLTEKTAAENGQGGKAVAAGENLSDAGSDRKALYGKFKSEFRDLYEAEVSGIVKNRLKGYKQLEEKAEKQESIISLLSEKYGASDVDGLYSAIKGDEDYWRTAAESADMTPGQYADMMELKSKNSRYERELSEIKARTAARTQYDAWVREADEVKGIYPEFDLNTELKNPRFRALISAKDDGMRISLRQAYELFHLDEIKDETKKKTASDVVANVKARGLRPNEAGTNSDSGVSYATDVRNLTREQREEFARRASLGESVTFT